MKTCTKHQDLSLLIVRIIVAAIFVQSAWVKFGFFGAAPAGMGAGMVYLMQFLAIVEMLGGIAVLVGFLTRWAAAGLAIIMLGAIFFLQFMMSVGFATATGAGWSFPLMILAGCLTIVVFGAGKWSVDEMRKEKAAL